MAAGRPVSAEQRARAIQLIQQGMARNAIARELGLAASVITRIAEAEGLSFDRSKTQDAVAAAKVDRASRRGKIIDRLYARTEKLLDQLEADTFTTLVPVGMGEMATKSLTFVPSTDEKNLAASMNIYLERAARLEALDDTEGLAPVESMLGRLAERFGLVSTDG